MLKWYADTFALTEASMTTKTLRRLKLLLVVSMPAIPMVLLDELFDVSNVFPTWLWVAFMLISMGAFIAFAFSKFVNRFYARDKYLDEWELRIKHASMAFSFQIVLYTVFTIIGAGIVFEAFTDLGAANLSFEEIFIFGFLVVLIGMYVQIFHALHMVRPMDADEVSRDESSVSV